MARLDPVRLHLASACKSDRETAGGSRAKGYSKDQRLKRLGSPVTISASGPVQKRAMALILAIFSLSSPLSSSSCRS